MLISPGWQALREVARTQPPDPWQYLAQTMGNMEHSKLTLVKGLHNTFA